MRGSSTVFFKDCPGWRRTGDFFILCIHYVFLSFSQTRTLSLSQTFSHPISLFSLPLSHNLSLTHTLSLSHNLTQNLFFLPPALSLTTHNTSLTHTISLSDSPIQAHHLSHRLYHTNTSSPSHAHTLSSFHSHIFSLSHPQTHYLFLSHTHINYVSLTHFLFLSQTLTQPSLYLTHTNTSKHINTLSLSL